MHVVISDDYQDAVRTLDCFPRLAAHEVTIHHDTVKDLDALGRRYADADAIIAIRARTEFPAALVERLPKLRLISQTGHAAGHIDLECCNRLGITVCGDGSGTISTAELAFALILDAMRRISLEVERLRAGRWQTTLGRALHGRTLGIMGYGAIGRRVAGYADAFGMNVIVGGGRGRSIAQAAQDKRAYIGDSGEFFASCDAISLHLRLTRETRGIVTRDDLARMSPTSVLVNTSRAELIEPGALDAALAAGRPGYAAVDVYEDEPVLSGAHPLLARDNALCTPHLGYTEKDTYEMFFGIAIDQVNAFAAGRPINVLNAPATPRRG